MISTCYTTAGKGFFENPVPANSPAEVGELLRSTINTYFQYDARMSAFVSRHFHPFSKEVCELFTDARNASDYNDFQGAAFAPADKNINDVELMAQKKAL
jgi:hypothetical protein